MKRKQPNILLDLQYLPSIQWFSKIIGREVVYLESCEHYAKGSYRNRCHIACAQGLQRLSIPLKKGKNAQKPISEVEIAYETAWQAQHWQSIQSAYGKAPFFEYYSDDLKPFYTKKYEKLWDFNYGLLQVLIDLVGVEVTFKPTETYQLETDESILDFRGGVHPNVKKELPDADFVIKPYAQIFEEKHGFLPNLSILDALFCKGPESILLL